MLRPRCGWLVALGLLLGGEAKAADPAASCTATLANGRVLVGVELRDFLDPELVHLVRLGLQGTLRVELTLVRPRRFWFDERTAAPPRDLPITFERSIGALVVDGRTVLLDPARLSLARLTVWPGDVAPAGTRYTVELRASLQVVTTSSLAKVASFMAGGKDSDGVPSRSALSKSLIRTLASDLRRSAGTTCTVD